MRVQVFVAAEDPVSELGIAAQLRGHPDLTVVDPEAAGPDAVAVVVADEMSSEAERLIRSVQRSGHERIVLVVTRVDDAGLLAAIEAGAGAILRRSEATAARLDQAVLAATRGEGAMPPDLLGRLIDQLRGLQRNVLGPRNLTFRGLTDREIQVLRLVADGCDTREIARSLCYSERTVKNVIHDLTNRLHLRNRSHAVAYALREGLI